MGDGVKRKNSKNEIKKEVLPSELLLRLGIEKEDVLFWVKNDMQSPSSFGESYLVAHKKGIYSIIPDGEVLFKEYSLIDDIFAETYVSSGSIILCENKEETPFASFSLASAKKAEEFISFVRKTVKNTEEMQKRPDYVSEKDEFINKGRKKLFLRVLSYVPRYKAELFTVIAIIILASLVNVVRPYLTGRILYDEVLTEGGKFYGKILPFVLVFIGINALNVVFGIVQGRVGAGISGKIIYDIKTEVFESMQKLGMSFFTSKRTGNLLNRINSDALDIQYFLNDGLPNFIINFLTIAIVGLVLFITNPLLSIAVLIPVPLIAFIIKSSARRFKKLKWHTWRRSSNMNSVINDTLMGIRVVKAFGREAHETTKFKNISNALYENRVREGIASAKVFPLLSWIMTAGGLAVWGLGGSQVLGGKLTFGELMSFVGYLELLYNPVNFMVKTFDWWTNCMNSAQRIFEVTDRERDIKESENPVEIKKMRGEIELKNVTFSYEPNRNVLKNVSLKIHSGEMLGLVGHSGAGKSTITNIITRLYDVADGEVLIDGVNVKEIKSKSLHSNIAMVLQETFLFSGSIKENIAYGRPDAKFEEIIDAAKKANAHGFITALPDGYDTQIGKNGIDLSGGEKQRISIARAILMDPAILILDEATSSLDTQTEKQIQQAIEELIKGRTTIAIAHRLSTLRNANRLAVVEDGKIVECGTHKELMDNENGIYKSMVEKQIHALDYTEVEK